MEPRDETSEEFADEVLAKVERAVAVWSWPEAQHFSILSVRRLPTPPEPLVAIGLELIVRGRRVRDLFWADEWEDLESEPDRSPSAVGRHLATEMWIEVQENNLAPDGPGPTPW